MNELHLFAGIGGGILGGILIGNKCVCAVEISKYCRDVLLARQSDGLLPYFPIFNDVLEFDGTKWRGKVDVICAGFPCQDISSAKGPNAKGIGGKKSGLWSEVNRAIRDIAPMYVFIENSPMLRTRGLDHVLQDLAALRYDAKWGVFSAGDIGARHRRERLWIRATRRNADKNTKSEKLKVFERPDSKSIRNLQIAWTDSEIGMAGKPNVFPGWMDAAQAIGNSQVPAVAAYAWEMLR